MLRLLALVLFLTPSLAVAQSLKCDGADSGMEWSYDITLEGDFGHLVYHFNEFHEEHELEVTPRGFLVPSPLEFEQQAFLVFGKYGWELELWNYDGTRNPYVIEEFFCIEK